MDALLTMCRQPLQDSAHFLMIREPVTASVIAFSPRETPPPCRGLLAPHGPLEYTVFLLGCGDLFENNIATSITGPAIYSGNTGGVGTTLGNVLRNNVVRSPLAPISSVLIGQFDVYTGNLFPGYATK